MSWLDAALLVAAGLAAGIVNAIAGGGSLISFPTMVAIGIPPVSANVSNSLSVAPGYASSVVGSRADLAGQGRRVLRIVPTALAGAACGCALLLNTPRDLFDYVVPFLVLGATMTLAFQARLRALVGHPREVSPARGVVMLHTAVFLCAVYGGYFNAALGVLLVAGLALVLDETLARVSALKNLLSAVVGVVTVAVYSAFGPVDWAAVAAVAPATVVGGYLGARLARRLPAAVLRVVIVVFGTAVGVWLLVRALFLS
ncbi:sulfite exporter TauE/SafE family protein [Catenuloplanes atrovinosus]|uniref:Probable membrane transporter protein n=1 Tax=Catenuloplanes atrovinosus TaxID=137266 RepID=A0AAE4CBD1_9ACTN|nr:sulfite exporter TauE/SafE family protein [Catenuloplanes atrovinosus]MDR7277917.1 putative membrane protein YfcA [Catenuloplanes atrovinosus]